MEGIGREDKERKGERIESGLGAVVKARLACKLELMMQFGFRRVTLIVGIRDGYPYLWGFFSLIT
eukprot:1359760-Amorphochlora_amoeboformis.AAC.1